MSMARWTALAALVTATALPSIAAAQGEDPTQPTAPEPKPPEAKTPDVRVTEPPKTPDAKEPAPAQPGVSGAFGTEAPKDDPHADTDGSKLEIHPYLLAVGGVKADFVKGRPEENKQNRVSTFALGRLGIKARWTDLVSAESEFMASGGIGLHGTSAYEGQAAMQVRQQVIRLHRGVWRVEAGRFIDEGSVDYYSAHVAESFLQDTATRDPLLFSGFNLGNGVRGQVQLVKGLRAALTFNAGNPVATTSSLMIGGAYPPFERFYTQPYQAVNQGPNHFPDDTFHIMVLTPSLLVDTKYVDARLAVQGFDVNTNMNQENDDHIRGYNVRGSVRAKLLDGLLIPFVSGAYTRNDTLVANNLAQRAKERYQAVNVGGGIDVDVARRFRCNWDCADGFGVQYQNVQYQVGDFLVTTNHYLNVGGTFWIAPYASVGARFAYWSTAQEGSAETGDRSGILSLRFIMQ